MSSVIVAIIGAIATLGAGAGLYSLLTLSETKRKIIAEADSVNAGTAALLSQSAREMLADANNARAEVAAARAEIAELRLSVAELTGLMRRWRSAILDPTATVDRLRLMVSEPNGR